MGVVDVKDAPPKIFIVHERVGVDATPGRPRPVKST